MDAIIVERETWQKTISNNGAPCPLPTHPHMSERVRPARECDPSNTHQGSACLEFELHHCKWISTPSFSQWHWACESPRGYLVAVYHAKKFQRLAKRVIVCIEAYICSKSRLVAPCLITIQSIRVYMSRRLFSWHLEEQMKIDCKNSKFGSHPHMVVPTFVVPHYRGHGDLGASRKIQ